ncbi:hypothetical protein ACN24M_02550 [Streptomyces microflavus]
MVLPLRRAVHNGRDPGPPFCDDWTAFPTGCPNSATGSADGVAARSCSSLSGPGRLPLAAGRSVLTGLCREPSFLRAASFTSADLLRAVMRAGEGLEDRRARKEEAGVLRHVTRAVARTTPLSAFAAVGWGCCRGPRRRVTARSREPVP